MPFIMKVFQMEHPVHKVFFSEAEKKPLVNCMRRVLLNHLVVGPPLKKKESRSDAVLFNVNNSSSSLSVPQYFVCCRFLGKFSSSSFSSYLMFSFRKRFSFLNETVISSLKKRKRRGSLGAHWEYKLGFCRTSDIFFLKKITF